MSDSALSRVSDVASVPIGELPQDSRPWLVSSKDEKAPLVETTSADSKTPPSAEPTVQSDPSFVTMDDHEHAVSLFPREAKAIQTSSWLKVPRVTAATAAIVVLAAIATIEFGLLIFRSSPVAEKS